MTSLHIYKRSLEAWLRVQEAVQLNFRALVVLHEKFNAFDPVEDAAQNSQTDDAENEKNASRLLSSTVNNVDLDAACAEFANLRGRPECKTLGRSRLTSSFSVNLPGCIPLFLARQSDKISHICRDINELLEGFKKRHFKQMQHARNTSETLVNTVINSNMPERQPDLTSSYHVMDTCAIIEKEMANVEEILARIDVNPHNQPHKTEDLMDELANFKFHKFDNITF